MNLQEQETLADVAYNAGWLRVKCEDSRELINKLIIIAAMFNTLYAERVASGEWAEDDYMLQVDMFAVEQFELHGLRGNPPTRSWNDGEVQHCARLVMEGGNSDVPREHMMSYLQMQLGCAQREEADDAVTALNALILVRQIMDKL